METIEQELRAAMDEGSSHLQLRSGAASAAWARGQRNRTDRTARSSRARSLRASLRQWRSRVAAQPRRSLAFAGALVVLLMVGGIYALGGAGNPTNNKVKQQAQAVGLTPNTAAESGGSTGLTSNGPAVTSPSGRAPIHRSATFGSAGPLHYGKKAPSTSNNGLSSLSKTVNSPGEAASSPTPGFQVGTGRQPLQQRAQSAGGSSGGGVDATRVVKTGSLALTVKKGGVDAAINSLTTTTKSLGGYVSQSRSATINGSPEGSLTLRIPVNNFEAAVAAATKLGHEVSLSTNAADVTGKFVDLNARASALKKTRATYLTILSRARTIGQTLSVQQRVNDIQQQIESLQGKLKLLRNQSSDGTLTVDVSEVGSPVATKPVHHHRSGFSKAWHNSTSRFNRGVQAIIGGLGPLLLALILLALLYVIARLVMRSGRRPVVVEAESGDTGGSAGK